ncbi:MAG TPA: sensor histidine kinase [Trebonia sp.]|jgi:signal transduction histidine kinase|nr:sensor histidine kinase [Trebonia sp.]
MGATTGLSGPGLTSLQPPEDITRGLFGWSHHMVRDHPLATDALLTAALLAVSTLWLAGSPFASTRAVAVQTALVATVAVRRVRPSVTFLVTCAVAFGQWLLGFPLLGDAALLIGLYTVAAHEPWGRSLAAAALLEGGVFMAALRWGLAGTAPRSLLFLTAMVIAALFAGLAAASGRRYLAWMDERARRLAIERDQQAAIAAAAERNRIARELHDIVSHSLSVVVTLADAAAVVSRSAPDREVMGEVSQAGRQALSDLRAMLGVLRTDDGPADLAPQPGVPELSELAERVRATGLAVDLDIEGQPFPLGASAGLTAYRIVQEALTNTIRHARATRARVTISYNAPVVEVRVADDGTPARPGTPPGHGIGGMRERAALHDGTLSAGPAPGGGWLVTAVLRPEAQS